MSKGLKLTGIIVSATVVDVLVLSNVSFGESAIGTATASSVLVASGIGLVYGLYSLYFKTNEKNALPTVMNHDDYIEALRPYQNSRALKEDITFILEQMNRLEKKKDQLNSLLTKRFDPSELTYRKFSNVIEGVLNFFDQNVKNMVNRITYFDESEYKSILDKDTRHFSQQILQEKTEIYNEYMTFVKKAVEINEEILMDLDKLVLEISRLDTIDIKDIDTMECVKEMNALIEQTKYYKN